MEGVLWKWTNYWNGWQQRWFILDKGILTYYKSQEEVNQGCKGSVKVSACEIVVHQTDSRRMDLVIPSEQHFYLRAPSAQERQQWLVALGSSKAAQQAEPAAAGVESSVRAKKSELRLYCDLLMQQVHTIKNAPDAQAANDLLSATCDTFIATLEDCMRLADANFTFELPHQQVRDSALPHESPPRAAPERRRRTTGVTGAVVTPHLEQPLDYRTDPLAAPVPPAPPVPPAALASPAPPAALAPPVPPAPPAPPTPPARSVRTFFSTMERSFTDLEASDPPTEQFLGCCRSVLPVFDVLGSTAFAPVKMDIQGNIGKLHAHWQTDPGGLHRLLALVQREVDAGTTEAAGSATDALLWLKRALAFIAAFLGQVQAGNGDLSDCASVAYGNTLRCHHGWVVRSVFAVALRALPELDAFVRALAPSPEDACHPEYRRQLMDDCAAYVQALRAVLIALDAFYLGHGLEVP
ncbi:unnamed protein product [Ixodes pacificus]